MYGTAMAWDSRLQKVTNCSVYRGNYCVQSQSMAALYCLLSTIRSCHGLGLHTENTSVYRAISYFVQPRVPIHGRDLRVAWKFGCQVPDRLPPVT